MPALNPSQIRVAATGAIWKAILGTTLPTDATSAWDPAFVNLGYTTDGFEFDQNLTTKVVTVWQSIETARKIVTSLIRVCKFELQQSNKTTLAMAWGGTITPAAGTPVGGAVTIGTAGVLTTATAHGLAVGAAVTLATVVTSTGILASTVYYVVAVGSATTLTLSLTLGGVALTTTAGTGTGLAVAGAYALALLDANTIPDFVLGIDVVDGPMAGRYIIQQGSLNTLPVIKGTRMDSTAYAFEIQCIKPADGTQSVKIYGFDVNAVA